MILALTSLALAIAPVPDLTLAELSYSLGVGDLNGDGFDDLVSLDGFANLRVFAGGPGGLGALTRMVSSPGLFPFPGSLVVLDADGDGFDDVLLTDSTNNYAWNARLHRGGPQGLRSAVAWSGATFNGLADPVLASGDPDGDGREDFVACERDTPFGGFPSCSVWFGAVGAAMSAGPSWPLRPNQTQVAAAFSDLDGDRFDDLAVVDPPSATIQVAAGSAAGPLGQTWVIRSPAGAANRFGFSVAGGMDLDGDGFEDLAVATQDGFATVLGSAAGPGGAVPVLRNPPGLDLANLAPSADVDGDGLDEVVVAWPLLDPGGVVDGGGVGVYLGGRTPPAVPGPYAHQGDAGQALGTFLATGDFDADGFADRAFSTMDGQIGVVYGP